MSHFARGGGSSVTLPVGVVNGGTGATTPAAARANLGLANLYWPARPLGVGEVLAPAGLTAVPPNSNLTAGRLLLVPYDLQEPGTLVRFRWYMSAIAAQTTNVRFGLFSVNAALLATLLLDAGETVVPSGLAAQSVIYSGTFNFPAPAGRIWGGAIFSASLTGATFTSSSFGLDLPATDAPGVSGGAGFGLSATIAYGAMPATQQMAAVALMRPAIMGLDVGSVP